MSERRFDNITGVEPDVALTISAEADRLLEAAPQDLVKWAKRTSIVLALKAEYLARNATDADDLKKAGDSFRAIIAPILSVPKPDRSRRADGSKK